MTPAAEKCPVKPFDEEHGEIRSQVPACNLSLAEAVKLNSEEAIKPHNCVMVEGVCVSANVATALFKVKDDYLPPNPRVESRPVKLMRALAAEAIGTGMIVLVGCGCVLSTLSGAFSGIWQVAVIWGLGVALAIYTTAEASGAHLNPAVTLAFLLVRPSAHEMTIPKAVMYMAAQLAGAILAGTMNLMVYGSTITAFERVNNIVRGEPDSIKTASAFGEYFPNPGLSTEWGDGPYMQDDISPLHACLIEAWGTFLLCFVIFSITNTGNKALGNAARPGVPIMIGFTVAVLLALYAPITQAGWNPARDFGPRLVAAMAGWGKVAIPGPRNGFWVYIVGPFIGGPLGAVVGEFALWPRERSLGQEH